MLVAAKGAPARPCAQQAARFVLEKDPSIVARPL
jgi:hypothetical protein